MKLLIVSFQMSLKNMNVTDTPLTSKPPSIERNNNKRRVLGKLQEVCEAGRGGGVAPVPLASPSPIISYNSVAPGFKCTYCTPSFSRYHSHSVNKMTTSPPPGISSDHAQANPQAVLLPKRCQLPHRDQHPAPLPHLPWVADPWRHPHNGYNYHVPQGNLHHQHGGVRVLREWGRWDQR